MSFLQWKVHLFWGYPNLFVDRIFGGHPCLKKGGFDTVNLAKQDVHIHSPFFWSIVHIISKHMRFHKNLSWDLRQVVPWSRLPVGWLQWLRDMLLWFSKWNLSYFFCERWSCWHSFLKSLNRPAWPHCQTNTMFCFLFTMWWCGAGLT